MSNGFHVPRKRRKAPEPSPATKWGCRQMGDLSLAELAQLLVLAKQFLSEEMVSRRRLLNHPNLAWLDWHM